MKKKRKKEENNEDFISDWLDDVKFEHLGETFGFDEDGEYP
jgi:hypothetical protein